MNRLVIIGNGFDLAHGLKTSYKDFIEWYWNNKVKKFIKEPHFNSSEHSDPLCSLKASKDINSIQFFNFCNSNHFFNSRKDSYTYQEVKKYFNDNSKYLLMESSPFLERIMNNLDEKGWSDIEFDYYQLLKRCTEDSNNNKIVKELNEQLAFIQDELIKYLRTIGRNEFIKGLHDAMTDFFDPDDFSTEGENKALENMGLENQNIEEIKNIIEKRNVLLPKRIMLLSFNYTATTKMYGGYKFDHNFIHGELEHPQNIIFGYGDDLERNYKDILDTNDNEMLKYSKSVKYLETNNYHRLLQFIESAPFQVFIMGHSCGISDRTLLNTIFEHDNCVSIKPFYHEDKDKGTDNYLDIVMNLSRNFNDKQKFRDRVVNKERCETI
ncbi:MAG: bacteriophage abortive infection AbiH family protein [Bacteroidaceae bacterium]|nr:bacteriophage abortive infection AbiH family protein [Bacteroidaceae bacterium]